MNEQELRDLQELNEAYQELRNPAPVICPSCGKPTPIEQFDVPTQLCLYCFGNYEMHGIEPPIIVGE